MPATLPLNEEAVHRLAPDAGSMQSARDLVRKKSFMELAIAPDGGWLMAQCKGSGKEPYQVSVDMANESAPVGRCTCPSRKFPCKHALGLMLAYIAAPQIFAEREPPVDLLAKRAKQTEKTRKKVEGGVRKVDKTALAKKARAQQEGLDVLEKLLLDLASGGQWFEDAQRGRMERQTKQMADAYLPGARVMLRRLLMLSQAKALSDEERTAQAADLIGRLWSTVQKGRNYLNNKLTSDENQAEADAVVEEVLGRVWQLDELKEKGFLRKDLRLLELAYERYNDDAREERIEISHLIEQSDGAVYQAITYRPYKGMAQIPEQPSYSLPLAVAEAAVYPGFINRRIRWEKGTEVVRSADPGDLQAVYNQASPSFDAALTAYRQQLKHPLAPREAVLFLRCEKIGRIGEQVIIEDAKGARMEAADRRLDYSNLANLIRAAGELRDRPALLARLFIRTSNNTIAAEPLALLTSQKHLRLGL